MTTRAPATERSRRTRAQLAGAAHEVVAREGAVLADRIAADAGVSTATFYAHFETHDDALAAALDLALSAVVDAAEARFHLEALLDRGVAAVAAEVVAAMHEVFRTEGPVLRVALARLPVHAGLRQVYRHHESRSLDHLVRQLDLAQKAGVVGGGPVVNRATSLLVVLQGINNPLLTKRHLEPSVAADLTRSIVALLEPGP